MAAVLSIILPHQLSVYEVWIIHYAMTSRADTRDLIMSGGVSKYDVSAINNLIALFHVNEC